jgi:hypothetical protein
MKIFSVVVLYNCKLDESHTLNSLLEINKNDPHTLNHVEVLIYDNGPLIQSLNDSHPANFKYFGQASNEGLAVAYNWALELAAQAGAEWLLLFDQDTKLPLNYFYDLNAALEKENNNYNIKAAAPKMLFEGMFFSPSKVIYGGIHRPISKAVSGISKKEIFAIGSGSILRVNFLLEIGGFNKEFWLDSLDRWLYHAIYQANGDVLVLDIELEHELSVMDYDKYISEERYKNIIKYESLFLKKYKSNLENSVYFLRLLLRSVKLYIQLENKQYSKITFDHLTALVKDSIAFGQRPE